MQILKILFVCLIFSGFLFAQNSIRIAAKFRLELSNPKDTIVFAAFSPDGEKVLLFNKESTQIWSAETGKMLLSFPEKIPVSNNLRFKWQPDGAKLLVFDSAGSGIIFKKKSSAFLYDTETGKQIAVLQGNKKAVRRADWSRDGKRILTFNESEEQLDAAELSVWTENGEFINSIYEYNITKPQFIDGGRKLLFDRGFAQKEKPIVIWDIERWQKVKSFDQSYKEKDTYNLARLVAISADEKLICGYYGISNGLLCWDAGGGESVKFAFQDTKKTGDYYFCGFSSDGKRFAVAKSNQNRIEFINSETGKVESFLESPDSAGCAFAENSESFSGWSADGRFFITHDKDDKLSFWETATGKLTGSFKLVEKYRFPAEYYDVDALSFNPTRPILMSVSNRLIRLWNLETGEMIRKFEKDEIGESFRQKRFANWSADGSLLMTGSKDSNAVLLWEILPE